MKSTFIQYGVYLHTPSLVTQSRPFDLRTFDTEEKGRLHKFASSTRILAVQSDGECHNSLLEIIIVSIICKLNLF